MNAEPNYEELILSIQKLERELKAAKSLNRSLNMVVENSPAAIVITDTKGSIEYVNPTFCEITGYPEEEAIGKPMKILKSGLHTDEYYAQMWKTISSGETWKDSFYNRRKNGEGYWEQQYIGAVKDENGNIKNYVAVKVDITLQKEFEQKLKASQDYLNAITKALPEIIFVVTEDGKYIDVMAPSDDPIYKEVTQAKGSYISDFMSEPLALNFQELIHTTLSTRIPQIIEYEMRVLHGNRWFEGRSAPFDLEYEGKKSIIFIAYDITERKHAQYALKESEARFRSIFESANSGIAFTDNKGILLFVNPTLEKILGYKSSEIIGKSISRFSHPEDFKKEVELASAMILNKKESIRIEKRYLKKDGSVIWADLSLAPIRDDNDNIIFVVGMVNDITERVLAENRLKELVATKDKLFSIIAHDLKNPFNALLGISELLYNNPENFDIVQVKELGKMLNESSRNAYELLENLLQWSRSQTGKLEFKPESLHLSDLVDSSIKVLEAQAFSKNIRLINKVEPNSFIYGDSNLLKTVFRNLCSNAVKYTNSGGWIHVYSFEDEDNTSIIIEDSGIGMQEESLAQLFKIEYVYSTMGTAEEKGTGLGLIICKEFVERHNGKLLVESHINKGTKFTIVLPKKEIIR